MTVRSSSARRWAVCITALACSVVACGSSPPARDTLRSTDAYNATRHGFSPAADTTARAVVDRLHRSGVACSAPEPSNFTLLRPTYLRQHVALPLGAIECEAAVPGGSENVVVEVFGGSRAIDFMNRKAQIICRRGTALGRKADGTNDFPGLPYVMGADRTWIVEPDSIAFNRVIATALRRPPRNACTAVAHA